MRLAGPVSVIITFNLFKLTHNNQIFRNDFLCILIITSVKFQFILLSAKFQLPMISMQWTLYNFQLYGSTNLTSVWFPRVK